MHGLRWGRPEVDLRFRLKELEGSLRHMGVEPELLAFVSLIEKQKWYNQERWYTSRHTAKTSLEFRAWCADAIADPTVYDGSPCLYSAGSLRRVCLYR